MTQKEFEDRTGLKPTPEEFNYIHALYMNTAMDKDEFCEDTDFYKQAVKMIGQREVTLRKIKMALPLWEEDMDYITMNLK